MKKENWWSRVLALFLAVLMTAGALDANVYAASEWSVSPDTKIYWVNTGGTGIENEDLKAQIQLFSQELAAKEITAQTLDIFYGHQEDAGANDILLVLDSSLDIPSEGYQISAKEGQLTVSASDADGLFYGCRYVEQSLLSGSGLTVGKMYSDAPNCPERAFFLDCGRKYYSPEWIEDMIKEISWSNMNTIYLHFSEEMGFRLESKTYPWLAGADHTLCVNGAASGVAADDGKYITQDEMRQIAEVAKLYHVEIIPSLDSPGHMNYAVKKYNEQYGTDIGNYFHYNGTTSIVQGSGSESAQKSYSRGIDISNSEAVTFAQNLYKEYAAFFRELGCTKFDIGGDELLGWGTAVSGSVSKWKQLDHWKTYAQERAKAEGKTNYASAVAYDGFMYYMNDIYDLVSSYGYTSVRMWNDDALRTYDTGYQSVVSLNPNIEIQYWTPDANNSSNNIWTYLNRGYKAYNFLNSYSYYVLGNAHTESGSGSYAGCTSQRIYENWNPYVFAPYGDTNTGKNVSLGNANIKGSAFCVWCDNPSAETQEEVKAGVLPLLRANGAKAWNAAANSSVDYASFSAMLKMIGSVPVNLPEAPEVVSVPEKSILDYTVLDKELAKFDTINPEDYTPETYRAYLLAAESAKTIKTDTEALQEDVDTAVEQLMYLHGELRTLEMVSSEDWLLVFASRSRSAYEGFSFVFAATVSTKANVVGYEIYDEQGNRIELTAFLMGKVNARTPEKRVDQMKISAVGVGTHTYTIYAIDENGYRSADSRSVTVLVK